MNCGICCCSSWRVSRASRVWWTDARRSAGSHVRTWLAAFAVSTTHPDNSDHQLLRLTRRKNSSVGLQQHSRGEGQLLGKCWSTISSNAALLTSRGRRGLSPGWPAKQRRTLFRLWKKRWNLQQTGQLLQQQQPRVLHVSGAAGVIQLACASPLKTFQPQILIYNADYIKMMTDRLTRNFVDCSPSWQHKRSQYSRRGLQIYAKSNHIFVLQNIRCIR